MLSRASWNLAGQIRLVSEYYQQTNFEANSKSQTKRQISKCKSLFIQLLTNTIDALEAKFEELQAADILH